MPPHGVRWMTNESVDRIDPSKFPGLSKHPGAELVAKNEEETRKLGAALARVARAGDFIALVGDLGAGKTTLMQGLVEEIDEHDQWQATSPTYALIQVYETAPPIHHMDLYRLEGFEDLESIGYWDYADSRAGIICVEWLDRIPSAWPGRGLVVEFLRSKSGRIIRLWGDEAWKQRVEDVAGQLGHRVDRQE